MEVKPLRQSSVQAGYKQTEVGVIPQEWECVESGGLAAYFGGNAFKSEAAVSDGVRWLKIANVGKQRAQWTDVSYLPHFYATDFRDYILSEGDVVMALTRPILDNELKVAKLTALDVLSLLNQRVAKVIARSRADLDFIYYVLQTRHFVDSMNEAMAGSDPPNIGSRALGKIPIAAPPTVGEQRAIAGALSEVDALIGALDQLIAKKRDLKQAAMQQLLTGQKRLPGFHGEWEVKRLDALFTFSGGYSASRDQLSTEGHCYLHYGDIHKSSKTFVDAQAEYQDIPKLNLPLKRVSPRSLLDDGDVVFVDASEDDEGTSRHVVVVNKDKKPFISGLHTIVAKSKTDELAHAYRRYCFQTSAIRQQFLYYAVGTKVSGISKTNIAKLTLPVPTFPEQTAIAAVLSDMDAELAALAQRRDKTRALKQGMMQELLTGRTRLL